MNAAINARGGPRQVGAVFGTLGQGSVRYGVIVLCYAAFFFRLGAVPITSPNEGLYAQIAREMVERHDWIVPHINSVLYFEKPPLLYWLVALSIKLFGGTAFAARLPGALAGFATVVLTHWMSTRIFRSLRARTAAVVAVITSMGATIMARQVMFDTLLSACMTLALIACWMVMTAEAGGVQARRQQQRYVYVVWVASALALLTKGLEGVVLPALIVLSYAAASRDWQRLRPLLNPGAILLFFAVTVPWHVAIALHHHEFLWFYFINEHVLRFLGRRHPADFRVLPVYAPLVAAYILLLPASVFLPAALRWIWHGWGEARLKHSGILYLIIWAAVPILFFTVARTRTLYYLLPIVPPVALLIGSLWEGVETASEEALQRRWIFVSLVGLSLPVFAAWIWCAVRALAHTPRATVFHFALVSGSCLVIACAAAIVAVWRRRAFTAFGCMAAGAAATWVVALYTFGMWQPILADRNLADAVAQAPSMHGAAVAVEGRLECRSAFVFYLPTRLRPVYVVAGRTGGDLEFGSRFPAAHHLFLSPRQLTELAATRPLFYVTPNPPLHPVPPTMHIWRGDAGILLLWTNRPLPPARGHTSAL